MSGFLHCLSQCMCVRDFICVSICLSLCDSTNVRVCHRGFLLAFP